jgi:hypothetical protein
MTERDDAEQPDVLVVLADTIQNQAQMYGQTVQAVNALHDDNIKVIRKLDKIAKKIGIKSSEDDENGSSQTTRSWTENKLLMVFLIIMALSILVLAGAKIGEVSGFFKQITPAVSVDKDEK